MMLWEQIKKGRYKSGKYWIVYSCNWWYAHKEHDNNNFEYLSMHPTLKAAKFWLEQLPK